MRPDRRKIFSVFPSGQLMLWKYFTTKHFMIFKRQLISSKFYIQTAVHVSNKLCNYLKTFATYLAKLRGIAKVQDIKIFLTYIIMKLQIFNSRLISKSEYVTLKKMK